ncbi:hypothetical protein WDU94_011276 [Cyamophila willieti]
MKPTNAYLGKVVNSLGVQAARNMKAKHRSLVSITDLASQLKAKDKCELNQLTSSVNHLIDNGLVKLILPEFMKRSFKELGLGEKTTQLCGSCCDPCCRPRLSVGVVYDANGIPVNELCGSCCGPTCGGCGDCCRPRLSIGVVYPSEEVNQMAGLNKLGKSVGLNQLAGGSSACRPRPSAGMVYPNGNLNEGYEV